MAATSSAIFCPAIVAVAVIGRYCGVAATCALALVVAAANAMHVVAAPTITLAHTPARLRR
ncbi:MAG: hypothetical protein FJY48_12975 [Betaproteobacteria bacterium]|nr:hypothetical protein [Betaproteobacteria bacterium]